MFKELCKRSIAALLIRAFREREKKEANETFINRVKFDKLMVIP